MSEPLYTSSTSEVEARFTYADLLQRMIALEALLSDRSLSIQGPSRLAAYRRELEKLSGVEANADLASKTRESLSDVLLECDELTRSIPLLIEAPEVPGWRSKVKEALGGQTSVRTEGARTPARDAQFEILLAALLKRAFLFVRFAEPDIIVDLGSGGELSVAAKRLTSTSKLATRVGLAAHQIEKSQLPGIVAVALGFLATEPRVAADMKSARNDLLDEVRQFAHPIIDRQSSKLRERGVLGVLVVGTRPVILDGERQGVPIQSIHIRGLRDLSVAQDALIRQFSRKLLSVASLWLQ